ncbi:MAG TPA: aminotransferase class V-fold PLP-dependent enzyme [Gaiellaceae bacterium]|nr:aminotransferase class V-fold PLP-dependent enzyme [Gaiellaceae bacterium]
MLARFAYLNAGTFGPLPRRSASAMADAVVRDLQLGRSSREFFESLLALREELRESFRLLLGAQAGSIALTASTTEACNVVLGGLGLGPGDEVVTTDSEHPGLFGGLVASGATLRVAAIRERPAAEALAALESELSERTRLIALSHVSWLTGAVLPVVELAGRGVPLLVDGAQAAGAIPVDVTELDCDFYTVSAQKWLLGPDATGCLYVKPEHVEELRLAMPSYLSWQHPEYEPKPDAARFDPGWIPAASLAGLRGALEFAAEVGEERFARARTMAERCRELLAQRVEVVTEPGQATLVTFRADEPEALVARLAEADVVVRDLPGTGWVRASCGWWTSEEDLERLVRVASPSSMPSS